jgi:hypothetical protein
LVQPDADPYGLMPGDLLFTAADLTANFSGALSTWLRAHDEMATACDLFFGNQYAPPRFLETQFIVHCQAAEALHAQHYESLRMPRADHDLRTQRVLDLLPPNDRTWVAPALSGANQKSLRNRVIDLIEDAPPSVQAVIRDRDVFAGRLVIRRNAVTHGGSLDRGGIDELLALNEKLRLLLYSHLMREVGLSPARIEERISGSRLLKSTAYLADRALPAAKTSPPT